MISNQIIQTSIDELKAITKIDIYVFDWWHKDGATTEDIEIPREIITGFPHLRQVARWSADITF